MKLLDQVDNKVFEGWSDYKISLLAICVDLTNEKKLIDPLTAKIKSMIIETPDGLFNKYENERLFQLLYELIEEHGTKEEADQFLHDQLQYRSFREELLNKHLREGKLEEVIELAKELFLHGEFEYYYELKELEEGYEAEFYERLKSELKAISGWNNRALLLQLITEENDVEALLEFVKDDPTYIEKYVETLFEHYEQDTINIYKEYIEYEAKNRQIGNNIARCAINYLVLRSMQEKRSRQR